MRLEDMLQHLGEAQVFGRRDIDIQSIAYHTDQVSEGACFVAIRGDAVDAHAFVDEAVRRGANIVVTEKPVRVPPTVTNLVVSDARDALARLSTAFFDEPTLSMRLVGVTGTNGKTTVTYLLEALFEAAGWMPGVIGTVEYRYGSVRQDASHTTPESYELQRLLRDMATAGVGACAMEVSSHALDMERVVGCHFDGAIFTNLTPEHLDYHGDMEAYFASKARLFEKRLVASAKGKIFAAVNVDDPYGRRIIQSCHVPVIRYGMREKADVRCRLLSADGSGLAMAVGTPSGEITIRSRLVGRFNAYNILAAFAAGVGLGIDLKLMAHAIERVGHVPGRLERVENRRDMLAFVDYAHTPDALENVLLHAKDLSKGRLIVVFGCGGDRDSLKRPLMGEAVARHADLAIVTNDNPRTEDPQAIIDMIIPGLIRGGMTEGIGSRGRGYQVVADRREAIARAVHFARAGDVIIVAGKGHERYQIIGTERRHFDDREELKRALKM